MSDNKFIKRLKGKQTAKSVLEVKNEGAKTSFANMPQGTSNAIDVFSDHRGNATAVLNGTTNWKISNSDLLLADTVSGDGQDFTSTYSVSGAGLWVNASYTFPSTGDPRHPVAMVFNPSTKWVLKLCGDSLIVDGGSVVDFTLLVKIGTANVYSKNFTIRESAGQFSKEFVIDFGEANSDVVKAGGLSTLTVQLLCGTANASARIYNGMTVLTCLQRKVDASAVSNSSANVEDVLDGNIIPSDYFSNPEFIDQIEDGEDAYAVFTRDGDDVNLSGWTPKEDIATTTQLNDEITARENADLGLQNQINTNKDTMDGHIANTSNPHQVTKAQVGLGNVDNTSDLNKPISTATQTALNGKADVSALNAHINNTNNPHNVTKAQVGLGNVDNTSDLDKPISTATQAALDLKMPISTKYGASISLTIDSSTYVVTAQLKDQDNNNLGAAQTIDLPLESVVVSGSYDSDTKEVILVLENGSEIRFSVADLVSGLQSEITAQNPLDADLVNDSTSAHKFVTATEKTNWNNHIANTNNPHQVTKAQVGLGNVNNTSDLDKPISTATQTALDTKADETNLINGAPLSNTSSKFFGVSSTAAATVQKEVSIPSITSLEAGIVIIVQPTITSTVANSTLKLNSFDAYPMRYNNAAITTSTDSVVWNQNCPSIFVFDGTYWVFAGHGLDSNTTYTLNYSVDAGQYTAGSGTYAVTRYSILAQKADGTWEKITATNANYSAGTSKSVNTSGFMLNQLRYYGTTTAVAGGVKIAANVMYEKSASVDMRYSTNCGGTTTWALGDYIYLVGTIGADGLFYLDTTTWWSNALPTTNDGKLYIRLGLALVAAGYTMSFFEDRPIFYHDGTGIKEYKVADNKQDVISDLATIRSGAGAGATAVQPGDLATVATTGDYDDLLNKPTIPTVDQTYDATSANAQSGVAINGANFLVNNAAGSTNGVAIKGSGGVQSTQIGALGSAVSMSTSVGFSCFASGTQAIAIGHGSQATASKSYAFGEQAKSTAIGAFQFGQQTNNEAGSVYFGLTTDGSTTNNYKLLGSDGKIPDDRINTTIARTSDLPTVNNPTITITQGGVTKGSFTLNQSSGDTIALDTGGGGSVDIDNLTITKNSDDELQAVATVNANTAAGATNPIYDWVGTLAEYTSQAVATNHPDWVCYITDDFTSAAYDAYSKSQTDALLANKVGTGHEVIEFQAPNAGNNYTWYRKYADGWVEQGGHATSSSATFTVNLPVTMSDTNYTSLLQTESRKMINVSARTTNSLTAWFSDGATGKYSWQVNGIAAA